MDPAALQNLTCKFWSDRRCLRISKIWMQSWQVTSSYTHTWKTHKHSACTTISSIGCSSLELESPKIIQVPSVHPQWCASILDPRTTQVPKCIVLLNAGKKLFVSLCCLYLHFAFWKKKWDWCSGGEGGRACLVYFRNRCEYFIWGPENAAD